MRGLPPQIRTTELRRTAMVVFGATARSNPVAVWISSGSQANGL